MSRRRKHERVIWGKDLAPSSVNPTMYIANGVDLRLFIGGQEINVQKIHVGFDKPSGDYTAMVTLHAMPYVPVDSRLFNSALDLEPIAAPIKAEVVGSQWEAL